MPLLSNPDGRVDPGGRTLGRLVSSAPAVTDEWGGDSSRWSQRKKLASADVRLQKKLEKVIEELDAAGFKPKIVYAWRSVAVQQELVDQGRSTVRFSFHNAQKKNGTPNAHAADIVDRRWAWGEAAEREGFWAALGKAARAEDLYWGGDWRKFKDRAHVQSFPNSKLAQVRRESGLS